MEVVAVELTKDLKGMRAVMQLQRTDVVAQVSGTTQRDRRSRRQMAHLLIRIMKYSKDIHFQL